MQRTGYSFHAAVGSIQDVMSRLTEIGATCAPISDRCSTFGFIKFTKAASKAGLTPKYGVELAVVPELGAAKPIVDYVRFMAIDSLAPLNELIGIATGNPGKEPSLLYQEALEAKGVIKIFGERARLEYMTPQDDVYIGLSPAVNKGYYNAVTKAGFKWCAVDSNVYPRKEDQELYRVMLGKRADTRTYPSHILSKEEWRKAVSFVASEEVMNTALDHQEYILNSSTAVLKTAEMFIPEKPYTLREMCEQGAKRLGIDLINNEVYSQRLDRELKLIADKKFEDYFYIIADLIAFAKQHMIVGPARGSSCGSLVCYLLNITSIDPIPYRLIFERFIDVNRLDLPDIDIDFSDTRRHMVFEYAEQKYGKEHVARLGTVTMFQSTSAMNQIGVALRIPKFKIQKMLEGIIERSSGDARANNSLEDSLTDTPGGKNLLREYPEVIIAARMENHPNNAGQHAAGIVITKEKVTEVVAIDSRTGATMCDKYDAEEYKLLKIDALGLTQLSIQERTLELIGEEPTSDGGFLDKIPLDDPLAFEIINQQRWPGIFQYNGSALQNLAKQFKSDNIEDIISVTALARPGPLATGGANEWVKRRNGQNPVTYAHALFEPHLRTSLGITIYQEQIMELGRVVGDLSWEDVTMIRKAMSKSLGKEFFDKYGDKWKINAIKKGIPASTVNKAWDDMCLSGDTKLINPHPTKRDHKYFTLRELYNSGGLGRSDTGTSRKRQKLLMWDGSAIKPYPNYGVAYSGKKQTYTLETESQNVIHATEDHKFLMPDGSYRLLKDLKVGDHVMSMGEALPTERKLKKGTGSGGHNWWHKLKAGEPSYVANRDYLKKMFKKCQRCLKKPYQETHHINFNHTDNRIENLFPVCRKCHKELHAIRSGYPYPWQKGKTIYRDRITSIEPRKIEDVYDVHMPEPHHNFVADNIIVHNCLFGSWAFNRAHAVAYGMISYQCCWLKAHYPLEFAAATLDAQTDPSKQLAFLRELKAEGIDYIPVDVEHSTERWVPVRKDNSSYLVGPLGAIHGIGPKYVDAILSARASGKPIPKGIAKKLENAHTKLDSLYPISDRIKQLKPNLVFNSDSGVKIIPTPIKEIQCDGSRGLIVITAVVVQINPRDENDLANIKRRGREVSGPHNSLLMFFRDDSDEIFCKIDRFMFEQLAHPIIEHGKPGKAIYAVAGTVPPDFRMIKVQKILYIGDME